MGYYKSLGFIVYRAYLADLRDSVSKVIVTLPITRHTKSHDPLSKDLLRFHRR